MQKQPRLRTAEKQRREQRLKNIEAHKFKPGQSGNPGGRPKKTPLTDELRKLAEDPKEAARAAKALFKFIRKGSYLHFREVCDRVEGPVRQRIEHSGIDGEAIKQVVDAKLSSGDLIGALRELYGLSSPRPTESPAPDVPVSGQVDQRPIPPKDRKKK